ncbi:hypothetical protein [Microcoleus sp. Pol12A6]|uniref:hypothetical protein n=1 Tax=Microcoleus sp. Pol12A6 TaxID=3055393 RepID=UPI002FD35E99
MRSACAIGNYLAPSSHATWVRQLWQRPDLIQRIKIALSDQAHLNFTLLFDKTHILHHFQEQAKCLFHKE